MSDRTFVGDRWKNILFEYDETILIEKSKNYKPMFIKFLKRNELKHSFQNLVVDEGYHVLVGEGLKKIDEFSDFAIETFYKKFPEYNNDAYLKEFKKQQKAFFEFRNKFVLSYYNESLVGCLVLGMIEAHPLFKESVWHVGYWGIDKARLDKKISAKIKYDWCQTLAEANKELPVVALIDYTNGLSDGFSKKLNFKTVGVRLDQKL